MKTRLLLVFFLTFPALLINAQSYPLNVQVLPPAKTPSTVPQALTMTGQPVLSITNTNPFQSYEVMIGVELTANNGVHARLDPRNKKPKQPIQVGGGQTVVLTGDQLRLIFGNYEPSDVPTQGITVVDLAQNPIFPEGNYTVCVTAYRYSNGQQLSASMPFGCSPPLKVRTPDPPIIISPQHKAAISQSQWQNVLFQWTPVYSQFTSFQYKIRIARYKKGLNPYEAIKSNNLLWWEEENIFSNSYLYDISKPPFENGYYVVQVTAYDPMGFGFVKNNGQSDVHIFTFKEEEADAPIIITPQQNAQVIYTYPQNYIFNWSSSNLSVPVNYEIKIAEVQEGVSPEDALNDPTQLIHSETDVSSSSFILQENMDKLELNKTYAFQVEAYDLQNEVDFKNDGFSNVHTFSVTADELPAPAIISPSNGGTMAKNHPQKMEFNWKNPIRGDLEVDFEFLLWEVPEGKSPEDALGENPDLRLENLPKTSISLETGDFPFVAGRQYVCMVKMEPEGDYEVDNNGYSEPHPFTVEPNIGAYEKLSCGASCNADVTNAPAVSRSFYREGDIVKFGNFFMEITQLNQEPTYYSGDGEIKPGPFFRSPISVEFNNVRINAEGEVIAGNASAKSNAPSSIPSDWFNNGTTFSIPSNEQDAEREISSTSRTYRTGSTAKKLPLHFGDIIITRLDFSPDKTTARMASMKRLPGDRHVGNKYLVFGRSNVCFSPAGPGLQESDAVLPLIETVEMDEVSNYNIQILAGDQTDPEKSRTALTFDCDGAEAINFTGYLTLNSGVINLVDENGSTLSVTSPKFGIKGSFHHWINFIADIYFDSDGDIELWGENFRGDDKLLFKAPGLKYYHLESTGAKLDHSYVYNPEGLTLPNGSESSSTYWEGLFFEDINLHFPDYIKEADQQPASIPVKNAVLDGNGLNIDFTKSFSYPGYDLIAGGWPMKIERFDYQVYQGNYSDGSFEGNINTPLFDETIPFEADIIVLGSFTYYQPVLDLANSSSFSVPIWNADIELYENSSMILYPSSNQKLNILSNFNGQMDIRGSVGNVRGLDLRNIGFSRLNLNNYNTSSGYLKANSFSINAGTKKVAGFQADLNQITLAKVSDWYELRFNGSLKLDNRLAGLTVPLSMKLRTENYTDPTATFELKEARLAGAAFSNYETPLFTITGVAAYQIVDELGEFRGNINADFMNGMAEGTALARFGTVNNYSKPFWMVESKFTLSQSVPLFLGLEMSGFGGGAYYNMYKDEGIRKISGNPLQRDFGFRPLTSGSSFGLFANTVINTSDVSTFNGRFELAVDLMNGSLSQVSLTGQAHFMDDYGNIGRWNETVMPSENAQIKVNGAITLDWTNKIFHGNMGADINIKPDNVIYGSNPNALAFHFDANEWYINIGKPEDRINLNFKPFSGYVPSAEINTHSYFNIGGSTDNILSTLGSIQFGMNARFEFSKRFDLPDGFDDIYEVNAWAEADVEGGIGKNLPFCSNHDPQEFFAYLGASMSAGGSLRYYDVCDMPLEEDCADWTTLLNGSIGMSGTFYTPDPTGLKVGFEIAGYDVDLTVGSTCQ